MVTQPGNTHHSCQGVSGSVRKAAKLRVLVVDDELSILELLKTALSALGNFDVSIATSGANALKLVNAQTTPFDCFLLDIQMPQMNGISLCQELRRRPEYRDAPITMLTAMSEKKYVDQAFVAGATDYVTKPFDMLELRSRLGTARRLVETHHRSESSIAQARQLKDELDTNLTFPLAEPVQINGIDRVLGFKEFENYVLQLSRGQRFGSFVNGVMIQQAEKLHDKLSPRVFRDVLHDIGYAIAKLTRHEESMISYRGNGVFLCVTYGKKNALRIGSETQLNQLTATLQARRQVSHRLHLVLGDCVPTRAFTKYGALHALNKAVENVETRDLHAREVISFSRRVLKERDPDRASSPAERQAYESVLKQVLREESSLSRY